MRKPRFCLSCYAFRDAIVCPVCKQSLLPLPAKAGLPVNPSGPSYS